jgi:3-methyl-2-oxobutanoate hydroxymethyltransferase
MSIRDQFIRDKNKKKKWSMLTAYDAPTARLLEKSGIDLILVGDSLGMVLLGYSSTAEVTMDEMIHHAKAVRRGAPNSFIIGDLPLKGVRMGPKQALDSARRFTQEAGMNAVKLEWSKEAIKTAELLIRHHIPVMGHIGLTPQSVKRNAGFRVQGQDAKSALRILENAKAFENSGVFSVVLECVPSPVGKAITKNLCIPTIGIGAGPDCDGQVLVFHDLVGIFNEFTPRFVKRYADLDARMHQAVLKFRRDVLGGAFPKKNHSFSMNKEEKKLFLKTLK